MKKPGIMVAIVSAGALWVACTQPGLNRTESLLVQKYDSGTFTKDGWQAGTPKVRARMLADLLRHHDFIGHKNDEVFDLLGSPTCYADYGDMPCYTVEFSEGDRRSLVFGVNHSDRPGTVNGIGLRK